MKRVAFRSPLFEAQFRRVMGHTFYGGAEVGECLAAGANIKDGDADSWHRVWTALAERLDQAAADALTQGARTSAREAYLRASNYYRASCLPLIGEPVDARVPEAYERQVRAFEQAARLLQPAAERLEIPYEGTTLSGWRFRAPGAERPRPLLIVTGGYDSMAEELYFLCAPAATARGYDCLIYDGPGQGGALIHHMLRLLPDWENVVRPVVDIALTLSGIDPGRIAMIGESLGGYLAPRAAAFDHRLAAVIADPGQFDVGAAARARLPIDLRTLSRLPRWARDLFFRAASVNPFTAWMFRRGMWTQGVGSPLEYLQALRAYRIGELATKIQAPTLVCRAEDDPLAVQAQRLFDALVCPKTFLEFSAAEGAGDHCESGARALFNQRVFDWLDATLGRTETLPSMGDATMRAE